MSNSGIILLLPFLAVLVNRVLLHRFGLCRKPLTAALAGSLFYWFLLSPGMIFNLETMPSIRWYLYLAMGAVVVCEGFQAYLCLQYGMVIEPTLYAMMSMTAGSEIREFLRTIFNLKLLLTVFFFLGVLAVLILLVLFGGLVPCPWLGYAAIALFLLKIVESIMKRTSYHSHRQRKFIQIIQKNNAMLQIAMSYLEFRQRYSLLLEASRKCPEQEVRTDKLPQNLMGIVVIGESACRGHHGLYGYARQTNPGLERLQREFPRQMVVFDDAIAAIPTTPESFEFMFTRQLIEQENFNPRFTLASLLKKAGFRQKFFGAQPRFSGADTSQTLIFSSCDESLNLNQDNGVKRDVSRSVYDEALLDYVMPHFLQENDKPLALFLNLYGSHLAYANRYPENWPAPFRPDCRDGLPPDLKAEYVRSWNEYDNSIAYTDNVLARMAENVLREEKRPCFMMYFSDHGEVMADGIHLQRSRKSRDCDAYEIPLIFIFNRKYEELFPEITAAAFANCHSPIQMDRFFASFCQAFAVDLPGESAEQGVFSMAYQPPERRTMDLGEVVYQKRKS